MPEVEQLAVQVLSPVTPLTTPCTLVQLKTWVDQVAAAARSGGLATAGQVTTTATTISVA